MAEKCDECGKKIGLFGGSFEVNGKTVCSKCEKKLRKHKKSKETKQTFKDLINGEQKSYKVLKSQKLMKTRKRLFKKALKETEENESVLSVVKIAGQKVMKNGVARAIITNKRVMIRNLGFGDQLGNLDIDFHEICNIKQEAIMTKFSAKGNRYRLHSGIKNLVKVLKELVEKTKDIPNANQIVAVRHLNGIHLLGKKMVSLGLYDDKIQIVRDEDRQYKIPLKRIQDIRIKTEEEVSEKEKSIIKRAVAGGFLFGGAGAIVGGMTGMKNKKKKSTNYFLSIDYTSKDGGDKKILFYKEPSEKIDNLSGFRESAIESIRDSRDEQGEVEL